MSQVMDTPTKKRKHVSGTGDAAMSSKKSKTDASHIDKTMKEKKKDKGKSKANDSEFKDLEASLVVSIPPVFAVDPRGGVEEMLDSMIMRYIPAFQGVVLVHSNLHFLTETAAINADCPFSICKVGFNAMVWSPHVGMKLVGKVNLCSPDHISLLVHRTFNVSIPRHHIPTDQWEFEYGPAENDPEFGAEAAEREGDDKADVEKERGEGEGGGRWIHRVTAQALGGPEGFLEFTVVGLTVANEMLSLLGSIQFDPFSPEHVPTARATSEPVSHDTPVVLEVASDIEGGDDDDGPENDTFQDLSKMSEVAAAKVAERRAAEVEEGKKEKRKRREDKSQGRDASSKESKRKKS